MGYKDKIVKLLIVMYKNKTKITTYTISAAIAAALALVGVQIVQAETESNFVTGEILSPVCKPIGDGTDFDQVSCCGRGDFNIPPGAKFIQVMEMTPEGVAKCCKKKC
jgi:hypothetical protein